MEAVNTKNLERLVRKADEFAQLDEITQRALKLVKVILEDEEAEKQKGEELDANSERSGGVNPRREEA